MKTLKIMTLTAMLAAFFSAVVIVPGAARTANQDQFDAATTFKSKCVACHGPKAEKKFDSSLPDAELIDIVMKGKKPEKPPNMPAYGEKGVTAEQAKALVEQMKQLKSIALGQTPEKPKPDSKPVPNQTKPVPDQAIPVTDEAKPVADQTKAVTDQSKPVGEQVAASPSAEQELISLDKSWGEAGLHGDSAILERILADDFIGNGPTGVATKAQNIAEAKTNAPDITNATYVADEYTVRFLDPNTAVMTHRAVEKGLNKGKEYNDQHRSMHVWVKRDGRWQVVASQATPIPQK